MVVAHGIGGAKDLPIAAGYAFTGAAVALAVSFAVLALAWRTPRFDAASHGRRLAPALGAVAESAALAWTLRVLGLVAAGYVGWAAVAGRDLVTNPTFGVVYVLLWVGIVPASLLAGPFYRAVSPLRTVHLLFCRAAGGRPEDGLARVPRWVGCWPAAIGLLAFVWLELVYPHATYLTPVRLWFAGYVAVVLVGAAVFGQEWFARSDPFEVYSTLVGRLSVFGRTGADGQGPLVVRTPLGNLDGVRPVPGLVGVVAVLLGSTAFDSFKDSTTWLTFTQSSSVSKTWLDLTGLLVFCGAVGLSLAGATMATGVRPGLPRRTLPDRFAHAVVPIVVGYVTAHYLSYFVEVGQQTVVRLSDPMGTGADLLGTGDWTVSYWLSSHPTFLAVTKVAAVVAGHVLGVVASHDRAVALLPPRHRVAGQLPLLALMVFYTVTGLALLFGA